MSTMMNHTLMRRLSLAIAVITIVSGMTQLVWPSRVLTFMAAEVTATSQHFFAIVGMFMVLFGALLWQGARAQSSQPAAIFWAGIQKFGAVLAVGLGVMNGIFSPLATLVAGFDLLSGIIIIAYWRGVLCRLKSGMPQ